MAIPPTGPATAQKAAIAAQPQRSVSVTDRAVTRARNPARPWQAAVQGKGLELVGLLLLVTVLPRVLGPTEYGRLLVALTILTLGSYAISLGAPSAFVRFIPAQPQERRAGLARSMTLRLLRLRAVRSFVVAAAVALGLTLSAAETFPPFRRPSSSPRSSSRPGRYSPRRQH